MFFQICTCRTTNDTAQLWQPAELIATGQQPALRLGSIDVECLGRWDILENHCLLLQIRIFLLASPGSCYHQHGFHLQRFLVTQGCQDLQAVIPQLKAISSNSGSDKWPCPPSLSPVPPPHTTELCWVWGHLWDWLRGWSQQKSK